MNLIPSIHNASFDVIALEIKHQEDYERSLSSEEFSQNYRENSRTTFVGGEYDGYLDTEPEPYQWLSSNYRFGYLSGVAQRFNEQFSRLS